MACLYIFTGNMDFAEHIRETLSIFFSQSFCFHCAQMMQETLLSQPERSNLNFNDSLHPIETTMQLI